MSDEKAPARPRAPARAVAKEEPPAEDIYGLKERFGAAIQKMVAPKGDLTVTVAREALFDVCQYLKEEKGFAYPILVTGVDRGDHLESVCHLGKADSPEIVVIKTEVPYEDPRVPSVTPLWEGANWHERESYDLMGIHYEGHPDLRRILLFEEWDEYPHPLRKEFKLHSFEAKFSVAE